MAKRRRNFSGLVSTTLILILLAARTQTQAQAAPGTINPPLGGSFKTFGPVSINLANLDIHLSVPIFKKPGRKSPFAYSLEYDSQLWSCKGSCGSEFLVPPADLGWHRLGAFGFFSYLTTTQSCEGLFNQTVQSWIYYADPAGNYHDLGVELASPSQSPCLGTAPGTYPLNDGSGLSVVVGSNSVSIQTPSGAIIQPFALGCCGSDGWAGWKFYTGATATDANGNQISAALANGSTPAEFEDTVGTTFSITGDFFTPQSFAYTDSNGTKQTTNIAWGTYTVEDNFCGVGSSNLDVIKSASLPQSVTYPDNSTEQFSYESAGSPPYTTGRLASVTLRTGATIQFAYSGGSNGFNCSDGSTATVTITTPDGAWTFSHSNPSGGTSTTTITDPKTNQMVVNFQGLQETQRQIFQGSSSTGTLLQTVNTCYNGNTSNCTTTPVKTPITEISSIVSLPNGSVNLVKETDTKFNSTGGTQEVDESLWGNNSPGSLGRKTLISYAALGNGIVNQPATVTICAPGGSDSNCGGSGTQIAQTTFGYDETGLKASGATQHVFVSGSRGNLTSIHRWLNPPGSTLSTTLTYDDAGQIVNATDPNGNTASPSAYGCNDAFPTGFTFPSTGVAHAISATYDCNTGLILSSTDQNGNKTNFSYDEMLRPKEVDYPDGGQANWTYPDPNHIGTQLKIDSSRSASYTMVLDSYGRNQQTQQATPNCSSNIIVNTKYDADGLVTSVSNPYCTTSDPTYGVTSFQYDALGRTTQVTHPDGSTTVVSYTGRATKTQDEGNGNGTARITRVAQADDFGRLASVCEVTSANQSGSNKPGACNQDIGATGFLTTYTYDLLNDVIGVQQSAVSRSFSYDSLSRLLSETHPESGTTSYTYDNNGNLLTRVRPAPNQGNPATTVKTTYTYDALNRPTQKSYSDGKTPTVNFLYDTPSGWGNPTVSQPNLVGRLSEAYLSTSPQGNMVFGYDAMGRIISNNQCTPLNCGTGNWPLSYQYDLLGDLTSATNGVGVTFNYTYDSAARLSSVTSSASDNNHPGTLYSNLQYNSLGEVTATSLGATLNEIFKWDCRGQILGYASAVQPATPSLSLNNTSGCPNTSAMYFTPSPPGSPGQFARAVSFSKPYPFGTSVLLTRGQGVRKGERGSITFTFVSFVVNRSSTNIAASYREGDSLLEIAQRLASQINNDKSYRVRAAARKVGSNVRIELTSQNRALQPNISVLVSVSSDQAKPSITATVLPLRRPLVLLGQLPSRQLEAK